MAPGATLYSVGGIFGGADTNFISDLYFQETPALTNALISNNSWVFAATTHMICRRPVMMRRCAMRCLLSPARSRCCLCLPPAMPAMAATTAISAAARRYNKITRHGQERHHRGRHPGEFRNITNVDRHQPGWHHQPAAVAAGDLHQLSGGRIFQPRQRGHRHRGHFWAVQAGRVSRRERSSSPPVPSNGTSMRISIKIRQISIRPGFPAASWSQPGRIFIPC